jgi:hypothetical protein
MSRKSGQEGPYRDCKASRHSVKIIGVLSHSHDLGNNGFICPFHSKDFCELLEVLRSCLSDGEDGVAQPTHTEVAELLIEKLDAELASKKRDIFYDGEADTPLLVFGQLNNGGKE